VDDGTRPAVLAAIGAEVAGLLDRIGAAPTGDLGALERLVRDGVLAIGARLLAAGVAERGTGRVGAEAACPRGGAAGFAGCRTKEVQALVGGIGVRRAYDACPACHRGTCPLDAALGLARDAHSPGVRSPAERCGALLPFAPAAALLADAAAARLSPSPVRGTTEAAGARREAATAAAIARGWTVGLPEAAAPRAGGPPARGRGGGAIAGAPRRGHRSGVRMGGAPTGPVGRRRGRGPGGGLAGAAVPRGGRRGPRRAGDLLRQPGGPHALRRLPRGGLGHRVGDRRGGVQAPDRRARRDRACGGARPAPTPSPRSGSPSATTATTSPPSPRHFLRTPPKPVRWRFR
jgi:hypothetical protein